MVLLPMEAGGVADRLVLAGNVILLRPKIRGAVGDIELSWKGYRSSQVACLFR